MSKNEIAIKMVKGWAKKIGILEARKRLVLRNLAPSTADQMVTGRYVSTPTHGTAAILIDEMAKDGFTLTDGKAS